MILKTKGVVIKAVNFGEADKIITILTEEYGKIQALAKGARKTKNKLMAGTQLFCFSEFLLYKGRTWYYINQIEVINSFFRLKNDLERLSSGTYIIQLISELTQPEQASARLFKLVIEVLSILSDSNSDVRLIVRALELKIMGLSGFKPVLDMCANCGKKDEFTIFSAGAGGVVCIVCSKNDEISCKTN